MFVQKQERTFTGLFRKFNNFRQNKASSATFLIHSKYSITMKYITEYGK